MRPPYDPDLTPLARRLRREATFPERLLWSKIRANRLGCRFYRQRPIGAYVADFCAPTARLVIEVDGRSHDGRLLADLHREAALRAAGYAVLRFTNDEVLQGVDEVVDRIRLWLEQHGGPTG
jgi:very-short-patch-repair endonuclease